MGVFCCNVIVFVVLFSFCRVISEEFIVRDSLIGSLGGIIDVRIRVYFKKSL